MVQFQKFLHFLAFLFLKEYENDKADMNFLCLKITLLPWDTLTFSLDMKRHVLYVRFVIARISRDTRILCGVSLGVKYFEIFCLGVK